MTRYLLVGGPYNLQGIKLRPGIEVEDAGDFRPPVPGYTGYYKDNGVISEFGIPQLDWVEEAEEEAVVDNAPLTQEELQELKNTPNTDQFDGPVERVKTHREGEVVHLDETGVKRG